MSIVDRLLRQGLISGSLESLLNNRYEVLMGSWAFGTQHAGSDLDVYGFYPGTAGGPSEVRISVAGHDVLLYEAGRFVKRVLVGRPRWLETLFAPEANILALSEEARMLRCGRQGLLHKGTARELRTFSCSEWQKASQPKEKAHAIRKMLEARQILVEGDLDIQRNRALLVAIRCGEWSDEQLAARFQELDAEISELLISSSLRERPDTAVLATLPFVDLSELVPPAN